MKTASTSNVIILLQGGNIHSHWIYPLFKGSIPILEKDQLCIEQESKGWATERHNECLGQSFARPQQHGKRELNGYVSIQFCTRSGWINIAK